MQLLNTEELHLANGGSWAHVGLAIAIADAAYDFYQGFTENRK